MAKPNYAFAKRQRDLAKKAKKEEKRLRKAAVDGDQPEGAPSGTDATQGGPHDAGLPEPASTPAPASSSDDGK